MLPTYPAIHFARLTGPRAVEVNVAAEQQEQAQQEPNKVKVQPIVQVELGMDNFSDCSICFDEKANHVALPCGHRGCCGPCLNILTPKLCPYCRDQFLQSQQVGEFTKNGCALYVKQWQLFTVIFRVAVFIKGRMCCMCQSSVVNTVCAPCGHAIVCLDGAPNYPKKGCAACTNALAAIHRLF